jgi:seryl-tRNA synthetase
MKFLKSYNRFVNNESEKSIESIKSEIDKVLIDFNRDIKDLVYEYNKLSPERLKMTLNDLSWKLKNVYLNQVPNTHTEREKDNIRGEEVEYI